MLPPENNETLTDQEDIDENEAPVHEIPGIIEVHTAADGDVVHEESKAKKRKVSPPNWSKNEKLKPMAQSNCIPVEESYPLLPIQNLH